MDLENDRGYESQYAPKAWLCWVDKNEYKPLITEKNPIKYRKANEQLPAPGSLEYQMLETLISYFADPYAFEACACKIVQIMVPISSASKQHGVLEMVVEMPLENTV